jgi:hypothetical protein
MPISKKRAAEIEAMAEKAIDTSEIPEASEQFFRKAKLKLPEESSSPGLSTTRRQPR